MTDRQDVAVGRRSHPVTDENTDRRRHSRAPSERSGRRVRRHRQVLKNGRPGHHGDVAHRVRRYPRRLTRARRSRVQTAGFPQHGQPRGTRCRSRDQADHHQPRHRRRDQPPHAPHTRSTPPVCERKSQSPHDPTSYGLLAPGLHEAMRPAISRYADPISGGLHIPPRRRLGASRNPRTGTLSHLDERLPTQEVVGDDYCRAPDRHQQRELALRRQPRADRNLAAHDRRTQPRREITRPATLGKPDVAERRKKPVPIRTAPTDARKTAHNKPTGLVAAWIESEAAERNETDTTRLTTDGGLNATPTDCGNSSFIYLRPDPIRLAQRTGEASSAAPLSRTASGSKTGDCRFGELTGAHWP